MKNTESFDITGMTCASCASAIERGVRKVPGVIAPSVNFATEKLTVSYANNAGSRQIIDAVKKAGYGARAIIPLQKAIIPIRGISCASCVSAIEKAVNSLE